MAPAKAYTYTSRPAFTITGARPLSSVASLKSSLPFSISKSSPASYHPADSHAGYPDHHQSYSARMPDEHPSGPPHWLSSMRSCLRLLIIVLSGSVTGMLVHTMQIYRGNISLDLRKGEIPMTWPARTNLAPTLVLFSIAAANFLASVAILSLSFKRSFRRPMRSRDVYRIVAGSFGVILWATALVVFNLLDKAGKASLGHYACMNRNIMSNGRFQYRAVCSEQGIAFYLAMGAASAEVLTLLTLAVTAIKSSKRPTPIIDYNEKVPISYKAPGRYP